MKTYPIKVEDGKVYAEVTLRDVVERCDVSDLPMLAEVKRLYDENDKLRKLLSSYWKATHCPVSPTVPRDYLAEMRKLGVEVD